MSTRQEAVENEAASAASADKRKRDESFEFRKSKKTPRTPNKNIMESEEESDADELKDMMKLVLEEIRLIREEQKTYREEMRELRQENKALKENVQKLEERLEIIERREKKHNIVIKGINAQEMKGKDKVEEFLNRKIEVNVKITNVQTINAKMIVAKIETWKDKMDLMKNKNKLKGTKIFIDNDLTKEELKVQAKLREIAYEENQKGRKTAVKYGKIFIDDVLWKWDRTENKIVRVSKN